MKRLVLRNGFTLRAHEGVGHLTDVRTGDALLVPASHLVVFEAVLGPGVEASSPALPALLTRYGAFLEEAPEVPASSRSFYELELEDAPSIPAVRPAATAAPADPGAHRVLAVVAPPSEPSNDWQLHGDAPKRAEVPAAPHDELPDSPWKLREPAAIAAAEAEAWFKSTESTTLPSPTGAPRSSPPRPASEAPIRGSSVPTQVDVPASSLSAAEELSRALAASDRSLNETMREPATGAAHLRDALAGKSLGETVPIDEVALRQALDASQRAEPQPPPAAPQSLLSQEQNLRQALEQTPAPSREEVATLLQDTAQELGLAAPAPAVAPATSLPAAAPPGRGRVIGLTVLGVTLLAASVVVSVMLRPGAEVEKPVEPVLPVALVDAGAAVVDAVPDAAVEVVSVRPEVDAGVAAPDAGTLAAAPSDAGAAPAEQWFEATVQARGRVKMAEVVARAEGTVAWTVTAEQRVKTKQSVGRLTRADGSTQDLVTDSVGLAMLKVDEGAKVKSGDVLAEIIYFEAWAKGVVRGASPTPAWRCEVVSETAGERATCKISVITPRAGGAQITVAIEPRWFDGATDAVLRVAPE
ncbi:MAG: hypothetical protein ACOZQL_18595 [Myxococcota bacterium]